MDARNTDRSGRGRAAESPGRSEASAPASTGLNRRGSTGPQLVSDNSGQTQQLSRVVELEIIPRLLMMHSHAAAELRRVGVTITVNHVATLAELAVDDDPRAVTRLLRSIAEAGATPRQLLLEMLAPCAALMGT